ncbi:MAG: PhnD/SsuA/transferrin family substrate-binding protein [Xanthomonadaceae bacterium]|nr:PhnD/SsuA/transferrin family substrate-binding protein [Xanthomonadaceae bacterium]
MCSMVSFRKLGLLLATWMAVAAVPAKSAELVLQVEPTFPADQIREVYAPLLSYLNRSTGFRFTLRVAPNFNQHWRELRAGGGGDVVFEEGHFFDYRHKRSGYLPLARTVEDSAFVIAVADPDIVAEGREGIVGRTVASLGAPNLGHVLVFDSFRNPLAQPEIRAISSKWSDGPDLIFAGDVEGTLLPSYMAEENPALTGIWRSRSVPGRVFSASPRLPEADRARIAEALLRLHEDPEAFLILNELRSERFVATEAAAYDGLERLLSTTFGYVPPRQAAAAAAPAPAATPAPAPTGTP